MRRVISALLLAGSLAGCAKDRPLPEPTHHWVHLPDGDSLHYTVQGQGADTILVLGGGPSWSSSYLSEPFAELARDHAIVLLDLRGRGRSSPVTDSSTVTLAQDLNDLSHAQSSLGTGPLILAGHGYGAGLAALYALQHEAQVSRLILLSPIFTHVNLVWQGSFQPNDSVSTARYIAARRLGRDAVDAAGFCREFWGFDLSPVEETDSALVRRLSEGVCDAAPANRKAMGIVSRAIRRSMGSWDWRDSLPRIHAPALILQGADNLFLLRTAQIWSELLPRASFVSLPGNPHFPWLGDARQFESALHTFLTSSPPTASRSP